jgi:hypothetical protein
VAGTRFWFIQRDSNGRERLSGMGSSYASGLGYPLRRCNDRRHGPSTQAYGRQSWRPKWRCATHCATRRPSSSPAAVAKPEVHAAVDAGHAGLGVERIDAGVGAGRLGDLAVPGEGDVGRTVEAAQGLAHAARGAGVGRGVFGVVGRGQRRRPGGVGLRSRRCRRASAIWMALTGRQVW